MGQGPVMAKSGGRRAALSVLLRLAAALVLMSGLSACAIPPAISIASFAADGVLLVTTGKGKADHGLSLATGKDCLTFRVFDDQNVCQDEVVAQAEPMPPDVSRELDRLRSPAVASGPGPAQALAAAFRPSAPSALPVAGMPRPLAAADLRPVHGGRPVLATATPGSFPGSFKVALVAAPQSILPQPVKWGTGGGKRVVAGKAGKHLAAAKGGRAVASAAARKPMAGKAAAVTMKTARVAPVLPGGKAPPRKVSALGAAGPVYQLAMR